MTCRYHEGNQKTQNQKKKNEEVAKNAFEQRVKETKQKAIEENMKNAEKYGFNIISDPGDNGRVDWKNDLWDSDMAMSWSERVNNNLQPYQKYAAWGMQGLRWYGFSPQMLANHYIRQLPNQLIKRRSADLKRIYAEYVLTDKVDLSMATDPLVNINFDFLNLVRSSRSFKRT